MLISDYSINFAPVPIGQVLNAEGSALREPEVQHKLRKVASRRVSKIWLEVEIKTLKEAFKKYNLENSRRPAYSSPCNEHYEPSAFSTIAAYPEVSVYGKDYKQIRQKWVDELCPNSLGTRIKPVHRPSIEELHKNLCNQWARIAKVFAKQSLNKLEGQYYSDNTIKNYCKQSKRSRLQYEDPEEVDALSEDEPCEVFAPKVERNWLPSEVEVIKKAFEKYRERNLEDPAYLNPYDAHKSFMYSEIAAYPEVRALGRDPKQIRQKWIDELCPNCLGSKISASHEQVIQELYQNHPRKWASIARAFAGRTLADKPEGLYYSDNTIKNYYKTLHARLNAEEGLNRKVVKRWSKEEVKIVTDAFRRYHVDNPEDTAYLNPCSAPKGIDTYRTIAEDSQVALLGRSITQITEKWINELCPNSLGTIINTEHELVIQELYRSHPREWEEIAKAFAEKDLEEKSKGLYYSANTIKNYWKDLGKRKVVSHVASLDAHTDSPFDLTLNASIDERDLFEGVDIEDFIETMGDQYDGATGSVW